MCRPPSPGRDKTNRDTRFRVSLLRREVQNERRIKNPPPASASDGVPFSRVRNLLTVPEGIASRFCSEVFTG